MPSFPSQMHTECSIYVHPESGYNQEKHFAEFLMLYEGKSCKSQQVPYETQVLNYVDGETSLQYYLLEQTSVYKPRLDVFPSERKYALNYLLMTLNQEVNTYFIVAIYCLIQLITQYNCLLFYTIERKTC